MITDLDDLKARAVSNGSITSDEACALISEIKRLRSAEEALNETVKGLRARLTETVS